MKRCTPFLGPVGGYKFHGWYHQLVDLPAPEYVATMFAARVEGLPCHFSEKLKLSGRTIRYWITTAPGEDRAKR